MEQWKEEWDLYGPDPVAKPHADASPEEFESLPLPARKDLRSMPRTDLENAALNLAVESAALRIELADTINERDVALASLQRQLDAASALNRVLAEQLYGDGDSDVRLQEGPDGSAVVIVAPRTVDSAIKGGVQAADYELANEQRVHELYRSLYDSAQIVSRTANLDLYRTGEVSFGRLTRRATKERPVENPDRQQVTVTRHKNGDVAARVRIDEEPEKNTQKSSSMITSNRQVWNQQQQVTEVLLDEAGKLKTIVVTTVQSELTIQEDKRCAEMRNIATVSRVAVDMRKGEVTLRFKRVPLANGIDRKGFIRRRMSVAPYGLEDVGEPLSPKKKTPFIPVVRLDKRMAALTTVHRGNIGGDKWPKFGSEKRTYNFNDIAGYHRGVVPLSDANPEQFVLADFIDAACQRSINTKVTALI